MNKKDLDDYITEMPHTPYGEMARRDREKLSFPPIAPYRTKPHPPRSPIKEIKEKETKKEQNATFSWLFMVLGFLAGAGYMMEQPSPDLGLAFAVGLISGGLAGTFYKVILVLGGVFLIIWLVAYLN